MIALSASRFVRIEQVEENRAEELHALGFHPFDALHIACAESGGANIFLTADDRLLRLGARHAVHLKIRVANPLTWLQEEKTK